MRKTAIIYGGSRKDGITRAVVDAVAAKISADVFDVADYDISFYDHEHNNQKDNFLPLMDTLLKYESWIFASPVYWYTMSAQLKVFVDRFSDLIEVATELGSRLQGINAALIATGMEESCPICYQDVFINTFNDLGINYRGCLYVDASNGIDSAALEKDFLNFVESIAI